MIKLRAWWIFYRKILFASLVISLALLVAGSGVTMSIPSSSSPLFISFAVVSPFAHLYLYEIDKPNEYYFFANLGLHKPFLWAGTLLVSVLMLFLA